MPSFRLMAVNGAPAFLLYINDALDQTLAIETDGAKITAIHLVRNPEKLNYCRARSATSGW